MAKQKRKAFVGFSSPIGYMYNKPADKAANDVSSSPNPVLFGSMGLLTLYDEIWFACRSLCPQSMRDLPYVRYLDVHAGPINLLGTGFHKDIDDALGKIPFAGRAGLNDLFPDGYGEGMTAYLGGQFATDNHTHSLEIFNTQFSGNLGIKQLLADIWLLSRYRNLGLEMVLNPLTARFALDEPGRNGVDRVRMLALADNVLTFGSLYDITGSDGPYHPCVEDMRNDPLIVDFRLWMREQQSRLDNQDIGMVEEEVNETIRRLNRESLKKHVQYENLRGVSVKLLKEAILENIPGAGALLTISEAINRNKQVSADRYAAFIALSRMLVEEARGDEGAS